MKNTKRIFIIHGWSSGPGSEWIPWLKSQLEKLGYQVFTPEMPNADAPDIDKWVGTLAKTVGIPNKNTYFIGHSIGCQTILRYLDSYKFKPLETIGGAIFVAGWFNLKDLEDEETEKIAKPWIKTSINSNKIKTVLSKSTLIISDNDPFDCFEENKNSFEKLNSNIVVLHNAGHLSGEDGYVKFPLLLEIIKDKI